jgi:hypothetical protein
VGNVTPGKAFKGGVYLRSASVTILLPISGSRKKVQGGIKPQIEGSLKRT